MMTINDLDMKKYDNKFELCDKYLNSPSVNKLRPLLEDVTCFSYLMFRLNGEQLKLYPYQDAILNDKHNKIIFRAARQIGKSMSLDVKAAYNILLNHGKNHNECIISASLAQSTYQMRRVKQLLNSMDKIDWKEVKGSTDNMSVISVDIKDNEGRVQYTNLLVCTPCTEGSLGYDFHEVNLDEFEYWETDIEHFYHSVIEPTTYQTRGRINIFSNPNGMDSFVAKLEKLELNGKNVWNTYIFSFIDCPGRTEKELEFAKLGKTRQQVESQLLAIRSFSDRNYFTRDEIDRSYDKKISNMSMVGKQPIFFLDVGATHDQCCLVGGYVDYDEFYDSSKDKNYNRPHVHVYITTIHLYPVKYPLSRVVGSIDSSQGSDGWGYHKSVKEYLDEWSVNGVLPLFGYDATGNAGMKPLFDSLGISSVDVTFSGPSKSGYYQRFKYMMEKGLLHRIKHGDWEKQAADLIVEKSARGYFLFNSGKSGSKGAQTNKRIPDDCMDSTAGFINLCDDPLIVTPGLTILGGKEYE